MPVLRVRDVKPGMMVANKVVDKNGRLIISAGEKISSKHLRALKAWGVMEVEVQNWGSDSEGSSFPGGMDPIPEKIVKEVDELFRYADRRHPAILELVELCILRKMELR